MKYRCIDNDDGAKPLTIGRVYESSRDGQYRRVVNDKGNFGVYFPSRFKAVVEFVDPGMA